MEVILTHEHADFDALASLLAARKLFPDAIPVLPRALNRNLRDFLVLYRSSLPFRRADELPRRRVEQAIFVDTQSAQHVRGMNQDTPVRVIDHHKREELLGERHHYWGEAVGATTTLLLEQIITRGSAITPIEATLLLLGIYEDTGGLTYASTTARDLQCAAWLLEKKAKLEVVNSFLHHPLTPAQQQLLKQLSGNAKSLTIADHTIVITTACVEQSVDEISTLAHKLRDIYEPDGLFLLVDLEDRIQIVARSTSNLIHVGDIAERLGGGGHARAAAALIRGLTLSEVYTELLELLQIYVKPPMTVRQLMSWNVNTLTPDITVAETSQRMQRLGHEGFPVVEEGELKGLITRRFIDKAIHHSMQNVAISRVMRTGSVTVRVDDSVQTLQQKMIESSWGQVPVVDDQGEMIGIVTRTDLLKLWATPEDELPPPSLALKMEEALPHGMLNLLRQVGQAASELDYPLYVVGGFARDLLLDFPVFDIDLVVEGEAALLAKNLSHTFGGRVRRHKRFGTAKWIRDDEAFVSGDTLADQTPASLDFASARTEFYEEATALPVVESSSIKLDLHRRDFTINTLAIRLDGSNWGELLDFYGGQGDLDDGIISVLHSLSFIEDPTRILRAARFEQRFEFEIEARTAELISDAVDLLGRVSGARIRHEINLILMERQPEQALRRLHELDVLRHIDPDLTWHDSLAGKFVALREELLSIQVRPAAVERLYFSLWIYRFAPAIQQRLISKLRLTTKTGSLLEECVALRGATAKLSDPDLPNSQLDLLLANFSSSSLLVGRIDTDDWIVGERISYYERELRPQTIYLSGNDLRSMDVRPGPIYRDIFQAIRAARLDRQISTEAEERALAEAVITNYADRQ